MILVLSNKILVLFDKSHGTKCSTPWNKVFHPMEQTGRCRLHGTEVPPPWSLGINQ